MKIEFSSSQWVFHCFSLMVVILSIMGFYINPQVKGVFIAARFLSLGFVVVLILLFIFKAVNSGRLSNTIGYFLMAHLFLITYGSFLSWVWGGSFFFKDTILVGFLLVSVLFSASLAACLNVFSAQQYKERYPVLDYFFVLGFLSLILMNALEFMPLPKFYFESEGGEVQYYSQGTTFLFGVAAVYFLHRASLKSGSVRVSLILISLLFLVLSLFAGARGDFIVSCVVCLILSIRTMPFRYNLVLMAVVASAIAVFLLYFSWEDILFFKRMETVMTGESFGSRDVLLLQSVELMLNNEWCQISGCGFNYFQKYFSFSFGNYPHNAFAELFITYGFIIGLLVFTLVMVGLVSGLKSNVGETFVFHFCLFCLGLSVKSGTLVSMDTFPAILFFMFIGMKKLRIFGLRQSRV